MLPQFLVIGALKSGSTRLHQSLATHPLTVTPSTMEEPQYFRTDADFSKGLNWYGNLFKGKGTHAFETSSAYTQRHLFPTVPSRIRSVIPHVRLIYVVRDPVERVLSHYVHQYATRDTSSSFSDAIRNDSDYIDTSRYSYQLEAYLQYFPKSQIQIVSLEDLTANPEKSMRAVAQFVGLTDQFDASILKRRVDEPSEMRRTTQRELELRNAAPSRLLASAVVRAMRPFRPTFERPTLTPEDETFLIDRLRPDVQQFRELVGRPFNAWRSY